MTFSIPKATPNGEYIVRFEQIAVHSNTEGFVTCAQIKVEGGGSGQVEDKYLVEFPGAYKPTDPIFSYNTSFFSETPVSGSTFLNKFISSVNWNTVWMLKA